MKTYRPRTWVSPKLVAGKSAIHGDGILAAEAIASGETLMVFGGSTISRAAAASDDYRYRSLWMVGADTFLGLPNSDTAPSLDENLNHSCDANAWLADEVTVMARRDIRAGAEITLDQGTWNFAQAWDFEEGGYIKDDRPCACGSRDCRRILTDDDWQLAEVQARYRGHFHPLVQKLIG
ncbi:MAG TPA: SET domain-containing protein-lysine N-methyltransferase [Rhizomicrobium sp.]|jgi:hypothetical protein|nr:SET domain-containing protein-lysine N-methyltransferase [Rhizomicrobium sp.]